MGIIRWPASGLPPQVIELDYVEQWEGDLPIPADYPLGPVTVSIEAVNGGDEPGRASLELHVVKPDSSLAVQVIARPARTVIGGEVDLKISANKPLGAAVVSYPGGQTVLHGNGLRWGGLIVLPRNCLGRVVLTVSTVALDGEHATGTAMVFVDLELPGELRMIHSFKVNSDELNPGSLAVLEGLAEILNAHPELRLRVIGHTDATGTPVQPGSFVPAA